MRLSLGNLPPLASHGLCFLLGVLFNSGSSQVPKEKYQYQASHALLALPKRLLTSAQRIAEDAPVALIKIDEKSATPLCRFPPDFAQLRQSLPFPVVALASNKLSHWQEYFAAKNKAPFRLHALAQAASLPLCRELSRVSYGTLR